MLGRIVGLEPAVNKVERAGSRKRISSRTVLPFSGKWMSELDNTRSIEELGATYTAPEEYLRALVEDYVTRWERSGLVPTGLRQRQAEVLAAYPKM